MNRRTSAVYAASGFIVIIVLLSAYFLAKKPEHTAFHGSPETQKVFIFKDVKYSGEKNGMVNWEVRAKVVKKFIDKPTVEMEGIDGEYRPKPDTVVSFKGLKGEMDTVKETGTIQNVEVYYKGQYVIKSRSMDFDFQKSMASTTAPVDLQGKNFTMMGVGLNADTKEQVITVERDVSGTIQEEKGGKYKFSADRFTYLLKDNTYVFEGKVVVKGEKMDILCDKVSVISENDEPTKADAVGHVRILSKGTIAKSERAVYYFREGKAVLTEEPTIVKETMKMEGLTITYDLNNDKFFVEKPKMRIDQRPRQHGKE
jgi:lipopolysaccharide transport protein LptA/LPS export ABC transporter protein LptC